jgi:hypothetical protein
MRLLAPLRSVALLLAFLLCSSAHAATVFVDIQSAPLVEDPLFASQSTAIASGTADLANAFFRAALSGTPGSTGQTTVGIRVFPNALRLTNPGPGTVVIEPGDIFARVESNYVLAHVSGGGGSSARCTITLTGRKGGTTNSVSVAHRVTKTFDTGGGVTNMSNDFTPSPGAGTITNLDSSLEHLEVILSQPGYTLASGESLDLALQINVTGASTVGEGSAICRTTSLRVLLDPGETLTTDAGVPLPWIGAAPAVPALAWAGRLLLLSLTAGIAWRRAR